MTPVLNVKTEKTNNYLESLIKTIEKIECNPYFPNQFGETTDEEKNIKGFQEHIYNKLQQSLPQNNWDLEYQPKTNRKDAIDIWRILFCYNCN